MSLFACISFAESHENQKKREDINLVPLCARVMAANHRFPGKTTYDGPRFAFFQETQQSSSFLRLFFPVYTSALSAASGAQHYAMRITKSQFTGLDAYKYSGIDKSVVSKYILGPFWAWLVTLFPKNIAPNTITFIGLCFVFTNVGTLLFFDPMYQGAALPTWVYLSFAFGLFAYQSMDAIDGKQARRTGMASALGEMFDHGCGGYHVLVLRMSRRRSYITLRCYQYHCMYIPQLLRQWLYKTSKRCRR